MSDVYRKTTSLCPHCAREGTAFYREGPGGMSMHVACRVHGTSVEKVENDASFFKAAYERDYMKPFSHLVLPVTYRCGRKCRYCYTLSNTSLDLPPDRAAARIVDLAARFRGDVTLIGGEPTVRDDLPGIVRAVKQRDPGKKVSLGTNGDRLADMGLVAALQDAGLEFVLLSLNDVAYEESTQIHRRKIEALANCRSRRMPVWLQRTIDDLDQLASLRDVVEEYRSAVFTVTVRVAKPIGLRHPTHDLFVSDMVARLDSGGAYEPGTTPFNVFGELAGRRVKLCSWVLDLDRLDPLDYRYIIATDAERPFHRGMKEDEILLKTGAWA